MIRLEKGVGVEHDNEAPPLFPALHMQCGGGGKFPRVRPRMSGAASSFGQRLPWEGLSRPMLGGDNEEAYGWIIKVS